MYITGIKTDRVTAAPEFKLGIIGMNSDGKVWKYVKILNTTATVAGVAGDLAAYAAATGHSTNTVVLDKTDADAAPVGAGLLGGTVTGAAGTAEYGWVQVKGPATANAAIGGTPADGDQLMAGTTDKALTKQLFAGTTPNIAATGAFCGRGTDVSAKLVDCDFPF